MSSYPLYVISKGRSQYMITSSYLSKMGLNHFIVVEKQELKEYKEAIKQRQILATPIVLDDIFKIKYETCDDLGLSKSTGPGPSRNFAWEHSKTLGKNYHWVMDDNIKGFFRYNKNLKVPCNSPRYFEAMERYCLRFENVAMAGPNYFMFVSRKNKQKPYAVNTRIYSCNFIRNSIPQRWRGRYNEDTLLSLDILRAGWCTIQFNTFLQYKMQTQALKGGNTGEFYHVEGKAKQGEKYTDTGTILKSYMLQQQYPDIAKVVYKFSRWHHEVDYSEFTQPLILKKELKKERPIEFSLRFVGDSPNGKV